MIDALVVANAVAHGARTGLAPVAGASVGNAVLVAGGAAGLTAVLALLVPVFEWVRWGGALYLIWLGFRYWRAVLDSSAAVAQVANPDPRGVFWHGAPVALTNPKTILFYAALFPQFVSPSLPPGPQIVAMSVTMVSIAVLSDCVYALLTGRLRPWLVRHAHVHHAITGTLLVGTGLGLAAARRS